MTAKEIQSDTKITQLFDPAIVQADAGSIASIDTGTFESLLFVALIGASGDTIDGSNFIEIELEESDDDSVFTDVADEDVVGSVAGTNTGTMALINDSGELDTAYKAAYVGNKQYVRPVINVTGTHTNGTTIGIAAIQGHTRYNPVT